MKYTNQLTDGYKKLFTLSPDGFVIIEKGIYVDCNKAALKLLKASKRSYIIGKSTLDISPEYQQNGIKSDIYLQSKINEFDKNKRLEFEWTHLCSDGSQVVVLVNLVSVKINKRNLLFGAFRDLTRFREQESRDRNLEKFVSMASHEFRSPLANILLTVEMLQTYRDKLNSQQTEEKLNSIINQVTNLDTIVSNFIILSRIRDGKIKPILKKGDLVNLCKVIINDFKEENSHHKFIFRSEFKKLIVSYDEKLMIQIIQNLLSNAVKFSLTNPVIEIELYKLENEHILSVRDNGAGIPENDQKQIFQPFFRAGNVKNTVGNGIGLNIVKESLRVQGFDITFSSKQDEGTIFIVVIPESSKY